MVAACRLISTVTPRQVLAQELAAALVRQMRPSRSTPALLRSFGVLASYDAAWPALPICPASTLPRWLRSTSCLQQARGPLLRCPRAVNPRAVRSSLTLAGPSQSCRSQSGQETMLYNKEYAANEAVTISGPQKSSRTS